MFAADEEQAFATTRDVVDSLNLPPAAATEHEPPLLPSAGLDSKLCFSPTSRCGVKMGCVCVLGTR